jgi:hypothetical protein
MIDPWNVRDKVPAQPVVSQVISCYHCGKCWVIFEVAQFKVIITDAVRKFEAEGLTLLHRRFDSYDHLAAERIGRAVGKISFIEGSVVKERRTASQQEKSIVLSTPRSGTEAKSHRYDQTLHKFLRGHIGSTPRSSEISINSMAAPFCQLRKDARSHFEAH